MPSLFLAIVIGAKSPNTFLAKLPRSALSNGLGELAAKAFFFFSAVFFFFFLRLARRKLY